MKETLISFQVAKLAKEKGFKLNCTCYYEVYPEGPLRYKLFTEEDEDTTYVNEKSDVRFASVTQSLLQKWLREVHNICIYVTTTTLGDFAVFITDTFNLNLVRNNNLYNNAAYVGYTYEEVLEVGLLEALKLIPNFKTQ